MPSGPRPDNGPSTRRYRACQAKPRFCPDFFRRPRRGDLTGVSSAGPRSISVGYGRALSLGRLSAIAPVVMTPVIASVALRKHTRRHLRRRGGANAIVRPAPDRDSRRDSDVAVALVNSGQVVDHRSREMQSSRRQPGSAEPGGAVSQDRASTRSPFRGERKLPAGYFTAPECRRPFARCATGEQEGSGSAGRKTCFGFNSGIHASSTRVTGNVGQSVVTRPLR